jgi:putative cardiolipin synthase
MSLPSLLLLLICLAGLAFLASILALRSYNRFAERARGPVVMSLPRGNTDTAIDRMIDPLQAAHSGLNGLANLIDPKDAFAARCLSADAAGRSLDIITYIWSTDTSGWLLIADVLAAADRGVRVRLLLDDINVQGFDLAFLGLTQHPNIEVRLFNPIRNRGHWLRRSAEFALGLSRFNRRMHGKVWIVDGRLAILGGRNIGDTYFGAPGTGARLSQDADMILVGPKLDDVATVFDSFWNMGLSLPILTLWPRFRINDKRFRRRLARHASAPIASAFHKQAIAGRSANDMLARPLRWTDDVTLLADPPDKALGRRKGPWLLDSIADVMANARSRVRMTTPYFVPGSGGLALLTALARRGVKLQVLTNALATTDLFSVHAAYTHYRPPLLAAGAELFEFAPPRRGLRKRALLHSKIFLIDDDRALVGSHNFDMRSAFINIEMGLLFREPTLVAELGQLFERQTDPGTCFAVTLHNGHLYWTTTLNGAPSRLAFEPEASAFRRLASWVIARMPHGWF